LCKIDEKTKREKNNRFDIVIVCPPTINTNLRKNALTPDSKLREAGNLSISLFN